jgi:hypothetical protein
VELAHLEQQLGHALDFRFETLALFNKAFEGFSEKIDALHAGRCSNLLGGTSCLIAGRLRDLYLFKFVQRLFEARNQRVKFEATLHILNDIFKSLNR